MNTANPEPADPRTPRGGARRYGGRRFDGGWVEREVAALDPLAHVPTDILAEQVAERGWCFNEPGPLEPPDPPISEPEPDRWLAAQMCDGCPVQRECLERELRDNGEDTSGVWAGLAEDDRRELLMQWEAHPARGPYVDALAEAQIQTDPFRQWARRVTATMPPMTDEEIAGVARIMRRIDVRQHRADPPARD